MIAGYTAPSGSCKHFGGLLLGAHRNGKLYYGKVGTGFSEQTLILSRAFRPLIRKRSPFVESRSEKDVTYLAPRLVAPVAFQEWTDDSEASPAGLSRFARRQRRERIVCCPRMSHDPADEGRMLVSDQLWDGCHSGQRRFSL